MADLPYMRFFPGDWLRDTRTLTASAKGAWIDLICAMWTSPEPGMISLRLSALGRLIGLTEERTAQVLDELSESGVCDREDDADGKITIRCRRVIRDYAEAVSNRSELSEKRSEAARSRWAKHKLSSGNPNADAKADASASAIAEQMECSPESRSHKNRERDGAGTRRPTLAQAKAAAANIGVTAEMADEWWHAREGSDWMKGTAGGGTTPVGSNWQADLKTYATRMQASGGGGKPLPKAPEKFEWEQ